MISFISMMTELMKLGSTSKINDRSITIYSTLYVCVSIYIQTVHLVAAAGPPLEDNFASHLTLAG